MPPEPPRGSKVAAGIAYRRVVVLLGVAVETDVVVLDDGLIGESDPDAVAAVVGRVVAIRVARRLGLEAVVMGVRGVVALEHVAAARPTATQRMNTPSPP